MHAVTKSELIQRLYTRKPAITKQDMQTALETTFGTIRDALAQGLRVELRLFGTFNVKLRNARKARNPKTGEAVHVDAKYVPFFHPSKIFALKLRDQTR